MPWVGRSMGRKRQRGLVAAQLEVERWNKAHPIGTPVRFWPGIREGEGRTSRTRTEAHLLNDNAVVWIEGWAGFIHLSHVERLHERTYRDGGGR